MQNETKFALCSLLMTEPCHPLFGSDHHSQFSHFQVIVSHNNNQHQGQVSIVGPGMHRTHVLQQTHINHVANADHMGTFVDSADDNPPPPPPRYSSYQID